VHYGQRFISLKDFSRHSANSKILIVEGRSTTESLKEIRSIQIDRKEATVIDVWMDREV